MREEELIYDWNAVPGVPRWPAPLELCDQTLGEGCRSPSVREPELSQKRELLHHMHRLGLEAVDLGMPAAGERAAREIRELAREIARERLGMAPSCSARPRGEDVAAVARVAQAAGIPVEVALRLPTSHLYGENPDRMLSRLENGIRRAVKRELPVKFVAEDAARSHPATLARLLAAALRAGAEAVCLCDTAGHATPHGARRLVAYAAEVLFREGSAARLEWSGRQDRGLAVPNALAALQAGARRVHATALGLGARAGLTPMELLLVNLKLLGALDRDLEGLRTYCEVAARSFGVEVPPNYPVFGADAFRTGTGVHAAAILKASRKGHEWLADRIYSGVPAGMFGFHQVVEIGPMSGESNAVWWLERHGLEATPERIRRIMARAKASPRILTDEEIRAALKGAPGGRNGPDTPPPLRSARR